MVICASSASNCLTCSKGNAETGGQSVERTWLREVKSCVHGVVWWPFLCQDLHAKLMSSGSHSAVISWTMPGAFHQSPVITNTVPSVWLCIFFSLHCSLLHAQHLVLHCFAGRTSSGELPKGLRPLNIAPSYICPCTTLFINLLLAELLIASYMDLYTSVKLNYKKFTVFR